MTTTYYCPAHNHRTIKQVSDPYLHASRHIFVTHVRVCVDVTDTIQSSQHTQHTLGATHLPDAHGALWNFPSDTVDAANVGEEAQNNL